MPPNGAVRLYLLQNNDMPESRKRPGHHEHQTPADIPASQRVKGRAIWAILCAVFAFLIAYFGVGENWTVLVIVTILGALIGYAIGRAMEKQA